jgi:ribonuclease BN (tRNA processing enzyme)
MRDQRLQIARSLPERGNVDVVGLQPPYFPASFGSMKAKLDFTNGIPMVKHIGAAEITPVPLSHPNGGYGFRIAEEGKTLVLLTDNEPGYDHPGSRAWYEYVNFCRDADLLIHDAQYTDQEYQRTEGWGHSTYAVAVELAIQARVKRLCLFHHHPDHSDAFLDSMLAASRALISGRHRAVDCFLAAEGVNTSV